MLLSEVLKQRRTELGFTLLDVANRMGVAEATVQRWESGVIKSIKYDKITKLAEVLNVEPTVLMGWEEKKPPEADGKSFLDGLSEDELRSVKSYVQFLLSQRNQ